MKSKKLLISVGLAVVLVAAFALPACNGAVKQGWYTPEDEKISFDIGATAWYADVALMVVEDLQDFGLDVELQALETGTYEEYLYDPPGGGMKAFVGAEDPSPDPWSDWIWMMMGNPLTLGLDWNPTWWSNATYDDLVGANYASPNATAKEAILMELQEILATEIPLIFLAREYLITAYRNDDWGNWYNEMGGLASWINEYSLRECINLTSRDQLNIGCSMLPSNLLMSQDELMWSHTGCLYLMLVYENLVGYPKLEETDAYNFTPKLATDFEVTYEADGTGGQNQVWTYTLREGVRWHDGENFTAEDVVHTCKYTMFNFAESRPVNWTAVWARDPDADEILPEEMLVTNTSEHEVQMRYIDGYHQNDSYVPNAYIWYAITPQHIFEGEDPLLITGDYIGTGPYKVEEFVEDSHLLLVRNDDYWGKDDVSGRWQLAGPKRVLIQLWEVMGSFWLAFEAGGASGMDSSASFSIPFEFKEAYEDDPDITVEVVDDLSVYYMPFNLHPTGGYAPLADLALRQAIAAAIDKEGIVDLAFGGYAEAQDSFVYNESPMHHDSLPNNTYDLTLAESILTDAGYILYEDGVQVN